MSYMIPGSEMSMAEKQKRRASAVFSGGKALYDKKIVPNPNMVVDRDMDYVTDLCAGVAVVGLAGWLSLPLAAVATQYSLIASSVPAAVIPQVPNNTVWVFYGAHLLDVGQNVSRLYFWGGRTGNIPLAEYDLEKLYSKLEWDGYFTDTIVYYPQDFLNITVLSRVATGVGSRIVLDALVLEPNQTTIVKQ